ncbi:MAG: hypothetical protein LLF89_06435 [Spirochaetaceae bacterium]|nr:hypothetical protein [Spirochaetaceae bacterium]
MDKPELGDWLDRDLPGRFLSWAAGLSFAFAVICLVAGLKANILELSHGTFSLLLRLALAGSIALFAISMAKVSLWIMYPVFGLRPFRIGIVLGWMATCVLSVIPLLLTYALSAFATGYRP